MGNTYSSTQVQNVQEQLNNWQFIDKNKTMNDHTDSLSIIYYELNSSMHPSEDFYINYNHIQFDTSSEVFKEA